MNKYDDMMGDAEDAGARKENKRIYEAIVKLKDKAMSEVAVLNGKQDYLGASKELGKLAAYLEVMKILNSAEAV